MRIVPATGCDFYYVLSTSGKVVAQGSRELCEAVLAGLSKTVAKVGDLFEFVNAESLAARDAK